MHKKENKMKDEIQKENIYNKEYNIHNKKDNSNCDNIKSNLKKKRKKHRR
jgi:hypothetical protein